MRILITGGAGFLGSHLCETLLKSGHQVIGLDNFITGKPENISHLLGNTNFPFWNITSVISSMSRVLLMLLCISPRRPAHKII